MHFENCPGDYDFNLTDITTVGLWPLVYIVGPCPLPGPGLALSGSR